MLSRAVVLGSMLPTAYYWLRSSSKAAADVPPIDSDVPLIFIHGLKGCHLDAHLDADSNREATAAATAGAATSAAAPDESEAHPRRAGIAAVAAPTTGGESHHGATRHYLTLAQALGFSHLPLRLPLRWRYGTQDRDALHASSTVHSVEIAGIRVQAVYDTMLLWMSNHLSSNKRPCYTFTYDWRRDPLENAVLFEWFCREIAAKHKSRVQVVAHSMGGVVTFAAVNRAPELFNSVVLAGVPFGPGFGYLQDLQLGSPTGYNDRVFSPSTLLSFGSSFWTFPLSLEEARRFDTGVHLVEPFHDLRDREARISASTRSSKHTMDTMALVRTIATARRLFPASSAMLHKDHKHHHEHQQNGPAAGTYGDARPPPSEPHFVKLERDIDLHQVHLDLYSVDTWLRHRIGVFSHRGMLDEFLQLSPQADASQRQAALEQAIEHMRVALARGRHFREHVLVYKSHIQYPPIAVLASGAYPTLAHIVLDGPNAIRGLDFTSGPAVAGDGRIPFICALPPDGTPYEFYSCDLPHIDLLTDLKQLREILVSLLEAAGTPPRNEPVEAAGSSAEVTPADEGSARPTAVSLPLPPTVAGIETLSQVHQPPPPPQQPPVSSEELAAEAASLLLPDTIPSPSHPVHHSVQATPPASEPQQSPTAPS